MRLRAASASGPSPSRTQLRRQRRAHSRLAIPVREAPHLELRDGDESAHPIATPVEGRRVDRELEPAERQRAIARLQDHLGLIRRGQAQRQPQVVKVGGEPHARIDRIGIPRRPVGQQEGIGVHRGGQVVLALLLPVRVGERQLGRARRCRSRLSPSPVPRSSASTASGSSSKRAASPRRWSTCAVDALGSPVESTLDVSARYTDWGLPRTTPTGVAQADARSSAPIRIARSPRARRLIVVAILQ